LANPAEIVPPTSVQERSSWIGSMKHSLEITGDIVSQADDDSEWEVLDSKKQHAHRR
jgi:hypothetical protein